jgi:hypothetical protein
LITWKPTRFYSRVSKRGCLKFHELKYEMVTSTKVVGEHSIQIYIHQVESQVHPTLVGDVSLGHDPEGLV